MASAWAGLAQACLTLATLAVYQEDLAGARAALLEGKSAAVECGRLDPSADAQRLLGIFDYLTGLLDREENRPPGAR